MNPTSISAAAEHLGGGCQLRGVVDSTEESGFTFHADYTCILQLEEGGQWRAEQLKLIPQSLVPESLEHSHNWPAATSCHLGIRAESNVVLRESRRFFLAFDGRVCTLSHVDQLVGGVHVSP
jgi:hypothetical protein